MSVICFHLNWQPSQHHIEKRGKKPTKKYFVQSFLSVLHQPHCSDDLRELNLNQAPVDTALHYSTTAYSYLTGNKSPLLAREYVIFGSAPFQKNQRKKWMRGQMGCYTCAGFSFTVNKKMKRVYNYDCTWSGSMIGS